MPRRIYSHSMLYYLANRMPKPIKTKAFQSFTRLLDSCSAQRKDVFNLRVMKFLTILIASHLSYSLSCLAIPQNFGGNLFGATFEPRTINEDYTENLIAASVWTDNKLPGTWKSIPSLDGDEVKILNVNPIIFGQHSSSIYANEEKGKLKSISILYLDSGKFINQRKINNTSKDIKSLKREFKKSYDLIESTINKTLYKYTKSTPKDSFVGQTDFLRNNYNDYKFGELTLRVSANNGQNICLIIMRSADVSKTYLSSGTAKLVKRERRKELQQNVQMQESGDLKINGIPMFRQGQRPYCAISTLGMATHYLGLRLGTDALAAGAKFRYIDTAKGSKMLDLYRAAAEESDAILQRGRSFDFERAQKYLEKGFPIVVWRRYSYERNLLHSAAARGTKLPESTPNDRLTWPTSKNAPGHASVITGFNKKTGEVIFMESWGEHARNKRMRTEELEATSYATFYFKL